MIQPNPPKFITKYQSFGEDMADHATLTKIEFGTLSTKAERLHINLELLLLGALKRTHGRIHGRTYLSWMERRTLNRRTEFK